VAPARNDHNRIEARNTGDNVAMTLCVRVAMRVSYPPDDKLRWNVTYPET
jgi:hypothetical protein